MPDTIPALFESAVEEVPSKVWLLTEEGTYTYEEALTRTHGLTASLRDAGAGHGVPVLATMRSTPGWLPSRVVPLRPPLVDGFRRHRARGISEGVKGTAAGGGEDKERSGTGAALTPKRRALEGKRPSTLEG